MQRIVILGKDGQMGRALSARLGERALAIGQQEVDFCDAHFVATLERLVGTHTLAAVINASAYTQVDKAEGEGRDEAFRINATAVGELAQWCKSRNLPLVHYSTDYVFDGGGKKPWREEDIPNPANAYGESKLAGELALIEAHGDYLLFRTSWIFDAQGKNFFTTMLRLMGEKETISVVDDQFGAPTYAPHLATATVQALDRALAMETFPRGTYHLCASGMTSWFEFASAILGLARSMETGQKFPLVCKRIDSIPTSQYPTPARRPFNSRLDCSKARRALDVALPQWRDGLEECMKTAYES
jgi:dTDP-4-dehydrorhamnose reductase